MVVENVRGAQPWVGRSRWNFGSFHLWGDVPALMPITIKAQKFNPDGTSHPPGSWFAIADSKNRGGVKGIGPSWADVKAKKTGSHWTNPAKGTKQGGDWFNASQPSMSRLYGSKSPQRKMASAMIAKIPLPLSRHIAATFKPEGFGQCRSR